MELLTTFSTYDLMDFCYGEARIKWRIKPRRKRLKRWRRLKKAWRGDHLNHMPEIGVGKQFERCQQSAGGILDLGEITKAIYRLNRERKELPGVASCDRCKKPFKPELNMWGVTVNCDPCADYIARTAVC